MDFIIEFIAEYFVSLLLTAGIILSNIFGRTKTAEELKIAKQKHKEKLEKKGEKQAQALEKTTHELEEIEKSEV